MWSPEKMSYFSFFSAADVVSFLEMVKRVEGSSKDNSGLLEGAPGIG